ncbi:MAG: S8 family peptidase [Chloroflexota bacterium]|nr:S8 family peptidase [Chloroflexota bacterium]
MAKQIEGKTSSVKWARPTRFLLLAVMLMSMVGLAPATEAATKAQPMLLQMAAQHPDQKVSIIVQKTGKADGPEKLVTGLGGEITRDLHIINAFSASVTAKDVPQIAKSADVRWVSMDAPVSQSSTPSQFTTWATGLGMANNGSVSGSFNSTPIMHGNYIWFNSTINSTRPSGLVHIVIDNATVSFTATGTTTSTYRLKVPASLITFDPAATTSTTTFDPTNNYYSTTVPAGTTNGEFASGVAFKVPSNLPGSISGVTWSARINSDVAGVTANWKWGASVYTSFTEHYASLGIKPIDDNKTSAYKNSDSPGTPENYKAYTTAGATGSGGTDYNGGQMPSQSPTLVSLFNNVLNIISSAAGPDGNYGYGSRITQSFNGFLAEKTPGNMVSKVEVALKAYVPTALSSADVTYVSASLNGVAGTAVALNPSSYSCCDAAHASTIYVDITSTRAWYWSDFANLQLKIDQSRLAVGHNVYYDAVGLRVTSSTGTDTSASSTTSSSSIFGPTDASNLSNVYNTAVGAPTVWNEAPSYLQGQGATVAVVDSGLAYTKDYSNRVVANVNFNTSYHSSNDAYGHGTFVAGIIAGDGTMSNGAYVGIAPRSNIVNVRVSDDQGMSTESTVVNGLQWINDNKATYNIKVVNLSLNSGNVESYNTSPLDAAVEILWFNGVTVVTSAGNNGTANLYAPANDPFVITVGAADDKGTASLADDTVAPFSAYGTDETTNSKPDLIAPGTNLIATLPNWKSLTLPTQHPANVVNNYYFRMSGTSMSAPVVAGAALLLLQDEPNLTPDQVKYRLKATANHNTTVWPGYNAATAGAGYLDIYAAVHGATTASANTGLVASQMLWTGSQPITWGSVNWNSVNWNSVNWNSVNWNSVNWNSVNWNSDYWTP